jgi:hypothetical protein
MFFCAIIIAYTMPIDSPLMEHIEYLQLRGLVELTSLKPYDTDWVIGQIDDILISEAKLNPVDRRIMSYFSPLMTKSQSFSYLLHLIGEYQNEPLLYQGSLDERFGGSILQNLKFSHAMRIRRANELDPLGPRPWNDFQVYLDEGLVGFEHKGIKFDLGRRNFLLGSGDKHSLILSPDPQGYDGFSVQLPSRYLEFYGMFSILETAQPRYLSVHRLGFNLKGFLMVGFTEAIVSADSLEPLYLNVFLPFYLSQWGKNRDDNVLWSIDLQLHLFNSILYGELLIDDYMYEDDPYPDKLAYQVGVKSLLLNSLIFKINYTAVDKWVYTQRLPHNVYERDDRCLGFPLGNDVDELTCGLKYVNCFGLFPRLSFAYTRKGEGSIFLPFEEEGGTTNPPFPSGVVDKSLVVKAGADYNLMRNFNFTFEVGKSYRYNADHIAGNDSDVFVFELGVWTIL